MDRESRMAILQKITINMLDHLGITFTDSEPGKISASMPVDSRTTQPFGVLHGGASVTLAESLGSAGSMLEIDTDKQYCVGLEITDDSPDGSFPVGLFQYLIKRFQLFLHQFFLSRIAIVILPILTNLS